jgi:hypothetical protein
MPDDAERCREHAKECWAWAASTNNPSVKESFTDLARRWTRLATEIEASRILFQEVGRVSNVTIGNAPVSITGRRRAKLSQAARGTNDGRPQG